MRFVHRSILIFVLNVVSHPWVSLIISAAVLIACISIALAKLNISTDQNKLFDPNVQFFRDYLEFNRKFPENEAIYVIVEAADRAHPPAVKRWAAVAEAIGSRLREL